jgi:hypothetical protein
MKGIVVLFDIPLCVDVALLDGDICSKEVLY